MNGPHDAALVAMSPAAHHGGIRNAPETDPGDTLMSIRPHRLAAVMLTAVVTAAAALPARAQLQLYAKAKAEGAVTLYVGGPTAPWEAMAKKFGERYPGIQFQISGGFSNVLDKKIDAQIAAGKLEVDTAILQTIQDFVRWKEEGRLQNFKPAGYEQIDGSFKDPDGAYWATMVNAIPYMFNTEKVAAADVPNAATDFLKPQFAGKVVTPYPADDDVTLWTFNHIVQKYGWEWMDKYMATKPNFIQGHLGQQRSIGSGQNLVTFDSIYNITTALKKQNMPVESHFAGNDATPIWPLMGAVFKGAPHPNAAKLFLAWLLEPEQQIATETWSGRKDVPPPQGYKPILSYQVANDYKAFMTNQAQIEELRKKFEGTTGPVVNAGGVR
jgi:ABC-type Fe3+ transport system substrate-binding protein